MQAALHPPPLGIPTTRELRECASCGTRFVGWNWHNRCRDCYRSTSLDRDQTRSGPDKELKRMAAELEATRAELARQRRLSEEATAKRLALEQACASLKTECDKWKSRHHAVLARKGGRAPIPPEILRRLLWLCHPDRHDNSDAATVATAWLLTQRPR